jgi:KDO2-lipid IV(A) lauroyltransferase
MKNAPVRHRVEYGLFRVFRGALGLLPHEAARGIGRALGSFLWVALVPRRRVALANLGLVYPELSTAKRREIARGSFHHLGEMACDTFSARRFNAEGLCARTTVEGWEHLDEARSAGHGAMLMSAHLGTWEIAAHTIGLYQGGMHVIGRPLDNPWLNHELMAMRTSHGNKTILKRGAARDSMRVLKQQGLVGILIDQRVRPEHGVLIPFMGQPAVTSPLLAKLAQKTGAPVVPIFGRFEPRGRYRVRILEPLVSEGQGDEAAAEFTRRVLGVVEGEIRKDPSKWLWLHKRWKL